MLGWGGELVCREVGDGDGCLLYSLVGFSLLFAESYGVRIKFIYLFISNIRRAIKALDTVIRRLFYR